MIINCYLAFDGQCKEAFEFYQKILGGEIVMMVTMGDTPMGADATEEQKKKIMHARLNIGDNVLMGGDSPMPSFSRPQGFSVSIGLNDFDEGKRIFDALSENATIMMPFEKTFWAKGFGMLIDQYGTPWMVNCE
ncbi:MAG: Glyoxalase/bleomycin resistance protein/dioxygenase [Capsulimonas sp.]|nr:Glyoxalase/bleomycin resistance protein/dioxygenase [Capsulimonas sp.]